jgi:hypothetical protein
MTRDLDVAKACFPKRYDGDPQARLGMLASSRDESHRSYRHLRECVTEFGAQGLELDGVKVLHVTTAVSGLAVISR